jgi:membrane fusion protein (multidrug efflux system)
MKRILNITLTLLVLAAAIVAIGWRLSENKETMKANAELTQTRGVIIPVSVAKAVKEAFSNDFSVNGAFQPSKELTVVSDVNGKIVKLNIDNGSVVSKNQVLLTVDHTLPRIQMQTLELQLAKGEKDLTRMRNLLQDGGVTQAQYEEAKLGVESLKLQIESLRKQIDDTYLRAPIAGVVNQKRVEEGAYIAPGSPVATIVAVNPIELEVFLTEEQVVTVKPGHKVKLTVDVLQGKEFTGTVSFVDVKADLTKRFSVRISLPNNDGIKAGMNGRATFSAGQPVAALVVPRQAFAGSVAAGELYVLEDGRAKLRVVETGRTFGAKVEIREGLTEGETVIVSGQVNLQDGAEVRVIQ